MRKRTYKTNRKKRARAKVKAKRPTIAANLQALCNAIGTTRDTYTRYRYHAEAPPRLHDGYDVEAWRAFLAAQGVTTNTERREGLVVSELKAEILAEDLAMRQINKQRILGTLIARAEADERLVTLAAIFAADLTNLRDRSSSIAKNGMIGLTSVHAMLEDCLANVRAKVAEQKFDRPAEATA